MPSDENEIEKKPVLESKSSMEILSELFSSFDADPPVIIKQEKEDSKKQKRSKKKHKHKDKKHKKKSKKRKHNSDSESHDSDNSAVDLSEILIETKADSQTFLSETLQKIIKIESVIKQEDNGNSISKPKDMPVIKKEKGEKKEEKKKSKKSKRSRHDDKEEEDYRKKTSKKAKSSERICSYTPEREKRDWRSRDRDDCKYRGGDLRDKLDKYKESSNHRHRDDYRYKDDYRSREYDYDKRYKSKEDNFYRNEDRYRDDKYFSSDKFRGHDSDRTKDKSRDSDYDNKIDKKKLLEIARRNAIQMMKSGNLPGALTLGPQAQEKVIAAIRSGGKTVEELTDFCKTLSRKEELGELSSVSEDSDSESDQPFHHPFQIKDKPLTINIKNSVPLPIKSNQERASELRMQFPVSSGQQHRKTESEWVPVSPKPPVVSPPKTQLPRPPPVTIAPVKLPVAPTNTPVTLPVPPVPGPQVFPAPADSQQQENIDIAAIVSQRLTAIRKLQENPNDIQAMSQMHMAQKGMNSWAESKQQIGQFTGSTGANILSQEELSSGYQAWARKDQLQTAAPVSGGMGMHLLQKMGWKPGEGLGKEKTGALEPLLLEVKLDKKGIVAKEEQKKKNAKMQKQSVKTLQGKHPVSLLGEFASKRKLGAPQYTVDFECGPDHKKNFLFKVILNGIEYKPNVASGNKKEAKALAATVALQQLGLLPS